MLVTHTDQIETAGSEQVCQLGGFDLYTLVPGFCSRLNSEFKQGGKHSVVDKSSI